MTSQPISVQVVYRKLEYSADKQGTDHVINILKGTSSFKLSTLGIVDISFIFNLSTLENFYLLKGCREWKNFLAEMSLRII